jgi:hypothetical protein
VVVLPEHGVTVIKASIDNKEIIVLGKAVLVDRVKLTLKPRLEDPITILQETSIYVLSSLFTSLVDWVMILGLMQLQIMARRKVLVAF